VDQGAWQVYVPFSCIPDVQIDPWQKDEAKIFAKRLLNDPKLWSAIDNATGVLYKRDPQSVLVVKTKNGYENLQGENLKTYLETFLKNDLTNANDQPIAFITPKIGKVKILNQTFLSEITKIHASFYGAEKFLLATCNAQDHTSKMVHCVTGVQENIPLVGLYPKKPLCFQNKKDKVLVPEPIQSKTSYVLR
ncbi:MAG TPA: hypothetical protein VFP93_01445, partial [Gammaproteobacteria bacterium]|nr:hypothetical protein [Gammaproteobacteria bacterium]